MFLKPSQPRQLFTLKCESVQRKPAQLSISFPSFEKKKILSQLTPKTPYLPEEKKELDDNLRNQTLGRRADVRGLGLNSINSDTKYVVYDLLLKVQSKWRKN